MEAKTAQSTTRESVLDKIKDAICNDMNGQCFSEAKHGNNVHYVYGLKGGNTIILVEYRNYKNECKGCDVFYPSREMKTDDLITELKKFAER